MKSQLQLGNRNTMTHVRVFISYTHDSENHSNEVLRLAQRLRNSGILSMVDRFILGHPIEGWPLWMEREIESADFVLIVCTPTYHRRFRGEELQGRGLGGIWESLITRQELYRAQGNNLKFIPVLFDNASVSDIPLILRNQYTHYRLWDSYDDLLRLLTHQPEVVPNIVGRTKLLPSRPNPYADDVERGNDSRFSQGDQADARGKRFAPSISQYMTILNRKVDQLTQEQFRVIKMLRHLRRVRVSGCAGSGKTLVAAEKSIRLSEAGLKTLFLCHNPLLAKQVTHLTQSTGVRVMPFSSWVASLSGDPLSLNLSRWTHYEEPDVQTLETAFDCLMGTGPCFDAVVVDEGQDFRDEWWAIVEAAVGESENSILYIFHDDRQALLPHRSVYPINEPIIDLSRNCRNAGSVYELMRHFHPDAPLPDPELKNEGEVKLMLYEPGSELAVIEKAVRWILSAGYGEDFVLLMGGSQSVENSGLANQDIQVPALRSWQEDIKRHFDFWDHPTADMRGVVLPLEGMAWVKEQLSKLSNDLVPSSSDIELVNSVARKFEIDPARRLRLNNKEFWYSRWDIKDGSLRLLRPDLADPTAAQIIMHLESYSWAQVIPAPRKMFLRPYDSEEQDAFVKMYNVADFKGLESDVVLLLIRGGISMVEQHLYVGISRARFLLAVLVDKGTMTLLPRN